MTVADWIRSCTPRAPDSLRERMLSAIGRDASAPDVRTPEVCLAAAVTVLRAVVDEGRFGRDSAIDLLTADALATYAYEHASKHCTVAELAELSRRGERGIGQVAIRRV